MPPVLRPCKSSPRRRTSSRRRVIVVEGIPPPARPAGKAAWWERIFLGYGVADYLAENSLAAIAEYDVGTGDVRGHAAHVLLGSAQFVQRFYFNQRTIFDHAADTKIIVVRKTVQ